MARTYDALLRAERIRQQGPDTATAAGDAELRERMASIEEALRELAEQLPREQADAEERLLARVGEEIRGLEARLARTGRQLAVEAESRLEALQRRLTRIGLVLGAVLLWILLRQ